ncbi:MAG TPA: hypothetical protein DDW52_23350, partial [Planctomycetaceae bacterium]|nr:hypothetical protein [Planctomycetaceae bacterium]
LSEGWQELAESRVVARLRQVPYVQNLETELMQQWENPPPQMQQAKAIFESPMVQNILRFLKDATSDEMFAYGDGKWTEALQGLVELNNSFSYAMAGGEEGIEQYVTQQLATDLNKIEIPGLVLGFRLSDQQNAMFQLNALEAIIRTAGIQAPELAAVLEKFEHRDVEDGTVLTISLDTSLIPLEEMSEREREVAERFVQALSGRSLVFSMAVRNNMFLLGISEDATLLDQVGASDSTLIEHEAIDVLKAELPDNLRQVGYLSKDFRNGVWQANMDDYASRLATQVTLPLRQAADRNPAALEWIEAIKADAETIDSFLSANSPSYGPLLSWQFKTPTGAGGRVYDWTDTTALENANPLDILNHSGGQPLLAFGICQAADTPEAKEAAKFLIDLGERHAKYAIAMGPDDPERRGEAEVLAGRIVGMIREFVEVLEGKIVPALSDRQTVFAMAGQMTISELNGNPLPKPLPVPELALSCKVNNQEIFLSGCADLLKILDDVVALVKEMNPNAMPPEYAIPRPQEDTIQGGRRFYYKEFVDAIRIEGVNPQIAINDDVVVFGFSERQVDDMLKGRSTNILPPWVSSDDAVAAVSVVDFAGITKLIRPWAEFGLLANVGSLTEPLGPGPGPIPTGNDLLEMWDCLTSLGKVTGTSVVGDDVVVSRWAWMEQ